MSSPPSCPKVEWDNFCFRGNVIQPNWLPLCRLACMHASTYETRMYVCMYVLQVHAIFLCSAHIWIHRHLITMAAILQFVMCCIHPIITHNQSIAILQFVTCCIHPITTNHQSNALSPAAGQIQTPNL